MRYKSLIISTLLLGAATIGVAAETDKKESYPIDKKTGLVIDKGFEQVSTQCTICHNSELIKQNLQDRNTWKETIVWMQETQNLWDLGENEPVMLDYLAKHYGIEGLNPPRRKNLPSRLMGIPVATTFEVAVQETEKQTAKADNTPKSGEDIYKTVCFACHDTGVAGSPKLGDKTAWAPRIATGKATMLQSVIKGKGVMPPKGGRLELTDTEIEGAVDYMLKTVQTK